jgi:F420-dependent oxidoreductase-like protein
MLGYWTQGPEDPIDLVVEAEQLGFDSVWTAEAFGSDAISPLCWIGARTSRIKLGTGILQISARTPACVAMTAATIDHLSNGRLILGIGVSGPQIVEGWFGQPFPKPMGRTREFVTLLRKFLDRDRPVSFAGEHYHLPCQTGAGLGRPLRLITPPLRKDIPVYLGAEGPRNLTLAKEIADGWMPLFLSPYRPEGYADGLEGVKPGFEVACPVTVILDNDLQKALRAVKWSLGFYIGGLGTRRRNFHADLLCRMGFEETVERVQKLFAAGRREDAAAAVPDQLADEISLVGSADRIRQRLQAWKESPVGSLLAGTRDPAALRVLAEANS